MARLLVEARTAESTSGDAVFRLALGVSVSRVDDGKPVTGLTAENFRLASHIGLVKDFKVTSADEWEWEPGDVEPAGCYALDVMITPTEKFSRGARYVFGLQARTFSDDQPPHVLDRGQTIVELVSLGE